MKYRYSLIVLLLLPFVAVPGARAFTAVDVITSCDLQSDPPCIIGWADDVFVGKVLQPLGDENSGPVVFKKYSVLPILNIKGRLRGVVSERQLGEVNVGATYIFAVIKLNDDRAFQDFNRPSNFLVSSISGLSDSGLVRIATEDQDVLRFVKACPNQIHGSRYSGNANGADCQIAPIPNASARLRGFLVTKAGVASLAVVAVALGVAVAPMWWRRRKRIVGQPGP